MQITITINCDNDSLVGDGGCAELATILYKKADAVEHWGDIANLPNSTMRDSNGNTIGSLTVEDRGE